MEWRDLEKMTVVKLRDEALKHPELQGVHGKGKEKLMDELAGLLGIAKPHAHFSGKVVHTKQELKHQIHELKSHRDELVAAHKHQELHALRREIHDLKRRIKRMETAELHSRT